MTWGPGKDLQLLQSTDTATCAAMLQGALSCFGKQLLPLENRHERVTIISTFSTTRRAVGNAPAELQPYTR